MERGDLIMILFTILLLTLVVIVAAILAFIAIMGGSLAIAFADLIVFGLFMWLIVKIIKRAKNGF